MDFLNAHLLTTILVLPFAGAVVLCFLPSNWKKETRIISLGVSAAMFILCALVFLLVDPSGEFDFVERAAWIPSLNADYHLGVDGVSALLMLLVSFLLPVSIIVSWREIEGRVKWFHVSLLVVAGGMIGVFASLDAFLFYISWQIVIVSMCFIVGMWGGKNRVRAAVKFLLFMAFGSACMLAAIIYISATAGSFDFLSWYTCQFTVVEQLWLFPAFGLAFAAGVPLILFHTWITDFHVEAPTAGSILLAGVFLKIGCYGFFRIAMPTFPLAVVQYGEILLILAVVGIVGGSLIAMVQSDIRRLLACSSIPYMGFVILGLLALEREAAAGAIFLMASHGLTIAALLALAGMMRDRRQTTEISDFSGEARNMPMLAAFFIAMSFSYIGIPGLNNFVGEFLIFIGSFQTRTVFASIALAGIIVMAITMLWLIHRVFFGKGIDDDRRVSDLGFREYLVLVPILAGVLITGICPQSILSKVWKPAAAFVQLSKRVEMTIPVKTVEVKLKIKNQSAK